MELTEQYPWCEGKILSREESSQLARQLKSEGKALVTVNGSFDLLHAGHLTILYEAKRQGDVLFVGMNSDKSVRQYKGEVRPIIPENERMASLAAISFIDYIILIDEPEAGKEILTAIKPQIHVNGSEYGEPDTWVEKDAMNEVGAKPFVVKRKPGLATSDIIKKIKNLDKI